MAKVELSLKGSLRIEISPSGLEAFAIYSPTGDMVYANQDILKLFQDAGVMSGFKQDEALAEIEKAGQKKGVEFKVKFASGIEPIATVPETLTLVDLQMPDKWKETINLAVKTAGPPQVFKEFTVKIEKEEVQVKKGALPFLPSKEERVKVVEKETKTEPVEVEPEVLEFGFIPGPQKVGSISPTKLGKPGKTVTGSPIQPPGPDDPAFYVGQNLERKGSELSTGQAGIVRRGKNWIDLIPFDDHRIELSTSDDKATLYLSFTPGNVNLPLPTYESILELAKPLNFEPNQLLPEHEFASLLVGSLDTGEAVTNHVITLPEDSFFDITVSEDGLKAVLNMSKGSGHGKHLVLKEVGAAINASGVKLTSKEKVKTDVLAFFNSPQKALIGYSLAEGKPATVPPPQTISLTVDNLEKKEDQEFRAQLAKSPSAELAGFPTEHLKTLGKIEKEQRIATLGPIVNGQPGFDVLGKVIAGVASQGLEVKLFGKLEKSQTFIISHCKGICLYAEHDRTVYIAGIEHADASFAVEVSPDKMAAYLSIDGHLGMGKPVDTKAIEAEIQKQGIKKGIIDEVLKAALAEGASGGTINQVCFAKGVSPEEGATSKVEFVHSLATGKNVRVLSDGSADYKNHDAITTVKAGEAVAKILPPEFSGKDGYDITGKDLKAEAPSGPEFSPGTGIKSEPQADGSTLLIATLDGELKREKGVLQIVQGYSLKGNVDGQSGNIKFPGPVSIIGDVRSTFAVISGADIKINGSVEAALLSAETSIFINGGVKGAGKAVLRAKTEVFANFIEMAKVLVVGDLKVKKNILKCLIKCNGRIMTPDDGTIMGGEIKVRTGLYVGNLGSEMGLATKVIFGSDVLVEDQIEVEEKEIHKLQDELLKVNNAMKNPAKISDKAAMQELFNNKVKTMKMLDKRNLRLFALKEKFELHHDSEIIIKNTLYPGVTFECHGRSFEVRAPKKSIKIKFDTESGRIIETPLESKK